MAEVRQKLLLNDPGADDDDVIVAVMLKMTLVMVTMMIRGNLER